MYNPVTKILQSNSQRGIKVIALSLLLVFVSAAPIMLYILLGPADGNPIGLGLLFAVGALVAHVGFVIGILMLLWDNFISKRKR